MGILIQEKSSTWIISPTGVEISRCVLDYSVTLETNENSDSSCTIIRIESDFTIIRDSQSRTVEIENVGSVGQAAVFLRKELTSGYVSTDGKLELRFSDNVSLIVDSNNSYEAWSVLTKDGERLICMPGGEVAYWSPERKKP